MDRFKALERLSEPWLTTESTYANIKQTILTEDINPEQILQDEQPFESANGIALVSLKGLMVKHPTPMEQLLLGATCTASFTSQIEQLIGNPSVSGVMLDLDSGGGSVQGVIEASQAVEKLTKEKPVVAFTDGLMASACYWIGSQASDIIASPSSRIGSIGVYMPVADYTEQYAKAGIKMDVIRNKEGVHKGAGLEGTKLTDTQRARMEEEVQEIFNEFKSAIQAKREVKDDAMQGQAFIAKSAVESGLIDAIGSFEDAFFILEKAVKKQQGLT